MGDRSPTRNGPATEIRLSDTGHMLIVGARSHDLPYSLTKETIGAVVEALAFYGREANHNSSEGRMPAVWADSGEKARSVLKSIRAIEDLAELEEE